MALTEQEKWYSDAKVRCVVVNPTQSDFESVRRHTEAIKQLVSVKPDPDPSGRVGGLYSWQQSPWD